EPDRAPAPTRPPAAIRPRGRGRGSGGRGRERARRAQRRDVRGVLRRGQHDHAGRQHLPPRPRPPPARVLHHPRAARRSLEAGVLPRRRGGGPRARRRGPELRAVVHRGPHRRRARGARRGDLRRGHGPPHLARHARAGPAAPRPGTAGLAGHRCSDRDRHHHRASPGPHRRDGHRRRARRRRLHRPPRGRPAARTGQGGGDQGAGGPGGARPRAVLGVLRLLQRPAHALARRRPDRHQPRLPAARPREGPGVAHPGLPDRAQGRTGRADGGSGRGCRVRRRGRGGQRAPPVEV
ncbi:MAG: Phosphoserine phosphatase, partial [uncultured Nocardioides sp.]